MRTIFQLIVTALLFSFCSDNIKNHNAQIVVEDGTQTDTPSIQMSDRQMDRKIDEAEEPKYPDLVGNWVGYFERDDDQSREDKTLYVDEGFVWTRENKINISIDQIKNGTVTGRSIVAGNDRPFKGTMRITDEGNHHFSLKEPGDHRYDGEFNFTIIDGRLQGTWTAYQDIDIKKRKYDLEKRSFRYNPDVNLERSKQYVNWNESLETIERVEMDENEFEEWIAQEFATATDLIYTINASNTNLTKSQVENLKRGDLTIIRNTIYARHGYSYKNRPLRVFFDAQSWYIPVHTDIKSDFTDLEKENIELLLRYEKNASEYYDSFGRG
ncbi:YARHG domain-containing protein [Portibacter marinus]|uniref:YARHG domain-containing protein n=1 Tax=Portibacter marinus TaxID=2898660 RepID=UPI001F22AB08|nr:YARHG domain-containing protein [Portibacter marinus]